MNRVQYLLDTNVVSEMYKSRPNPGVLAFLADAHPTTLHLSSLTIGELKQGVEMKRRSDPMAAKVIADWLEGLEARFAGSILDVDVETAKLWGVWSAARSRPIVDTLLAATAAMHELVFVTRNTRDVQDLPIKVLNPWKSPDGNRR